MTNLKKILIGIIVLLVTFIPLKVNAEETTIFDQFVENIENSTNSHYILKGNNFDYYLNNDSMTVYVIIGEKSKKLNLNVLFIKKNQSAYLRINNNLNYKNYYADSYGIIYGLEFEYNSTVKLDICLKNLSTILDTVTIPSFESINNYNELDIITTNGNADFPNNILQNSSLSTSQYLILVSIIGIVICIFLGLIIIIMVRRKKVNIRRENIFGKVNNEPVQEEYIEVDYSFSKEQLEEKEESPNTNYVYTKADLIDLYRKKFNNQITDAEFDYALKKYLSAREDEDQDD